MLLSYQTYSFNLDVISRTYLINTAIYSEYFFSLFLFCENSIILSQGMCGFVSSPTSRNMETKGPRYPNNKKLASSLLC